MLIEDRLNKGVSPYRIAGELGKSHTCIMNEINRNKISNRTYRNDCLEYDNCRLHGVCGKKGCIHRLCVKCKARCFKHCPHYVKSHCDVLEKSPHVCNSCSSKNICRFEKYFYRAEAADERADAELHEKRMGFDLTLEEVMTIDRLVSDRIKAGQSPYHIKQTLGDALPISESTLRRLINNDELSARKGDLHKTVNRKVRITTNNKNRNINHATQKIGHFYKDFIDYKNKCDPFYWEMDCVMGLATDRTCLLTLCLKQTHLQLAFVLPEHTPQCVVNTLDMIETVLGLELFKRVFPCILTDNGQEFSLIQEMIRSCTVKDEERTKLFFCEPLRSNQKGLCENNHRLIRYVLPKKTSFEFLTQPHATLLMNHINSYSRASLFGSTPYKISADVLPEDFFWQLGIEEVAPEDINLTPSLLGLRNKTIMELLGEELEKHIS